MPKISVLSFDREREREREGEINLSQYNLHFLSQALATRFGLINTPSGLYIRQIATVKA